MAHDVNSFFSLGLWMVRSREYPIWIFYIRAVFYLEGAEARLIDLSASLTTSGPVEGRSFSGRYIMDFWRHLVVHWCYE